MMDRAGRTPAAVDPVLVVVMVDDSLTSPRARELFNTPRRRRPRTPEAARPGSLRLLARRAMSAPRMRYAVGSPLGLRISARITVRAARRGPGSDDAPPAAAPREDSTDHPRRVGGMERLPDGSSARCPSASGTRRRCGRQWTQNVLAPSGATRTRSATPRRVARAAGMQTLLDEFAYAALESSSRCRIASGSSSGAIVSGTPRCAVTSPSAVGIGSPWGSRMGAAAGRQRVHLGGRQPVLEWCARRATRFRKAGVVRQVAFP